MCTVHELFSLLNAVQYVQYIDGTWDMGHGTWDMGHGTWDMGHGVWLYILIYVRIKVYKKTR